MKRILIAFIAAFAALAACQDPFQEPVQDPQENENGGNVQDPEPEIPEILDAREVTIEAGILTKTVLGVDNAVKWEETDKIALVFYHSENSEKHHVNKSFAIHELKNDNAHATFKGQIPNSVSTGEYNNLGYAVYPHDAIIEGGVFSHNLPSEQTAKENGSFASNLNLSSAALALDELGDTKAVKSDFRNALSVLKVKLSPDIESVTLTGSAALTGVAPLKMFYNESETDHVDNGRLMVDSEGNFDNALNSVTLLPPAGSDFIEWTEENNFRYSILVWPGVQEQLTITVKYKNLGDYVKPSSKAVTFKPAKFYNLNFNNTEELVVEELETALDNVEENIPNIDQTEADVDALLAQIQSVTLLTEYLDNAVYAQYGEFNNGYQKLDLQLDYIVRPESAAQALVDAFKVNPSVVSGVLRYPNASGNAVYADLTVNDLSLSDASFGKYVTASISASNIDKAFYDGNYVASVALNIASDKTDILSEFAKLIPKAGTAISGSYLKNIPAIPGARVVIPFNFAVANPAASYTVAVSATENVDWATVNHNKDFRTGNLTVQIDETKAIESQNVTLTLKVGEGENAEVVSHTFTFVDSGARINFKDPGKVDYIGGEVVLNMDNLNIKNYLLTCSGANQEGNVFSFDENTGDEKTASVECEAEIQGVSLKYRKSFTLTQSASGTPLTRVYYVGSGTNVKLLQTATNSTITNALNVVILGDGYKKKDFADGGFFERRAKSAMENFFGLEPFSSYRNRFTVYMAGYESTDEGTDITSQGVSLNTYFDSYWSGNSTAISLTNEGKEKVINVVKNDLGLNNGDYYRTIVIMLINTNADAGSTFYPEQTTGNLSGDGYHSFSVACVAANSTGFGGLVRHEAGGHAFGRLADEYITVAAGTTVSADNKKNLANAHNVGFYTNVTTDYNNYSHWKMFTDAGYSSEEVGYYEGAWRGSYGVWRSSQTSIMQSTGNTGNFNAVSRYAIWRRIVLQSKGYENDTMTDFKTYDQKNR